MSHSFQKAKEARDASDYAHLLTPGRYDWRNYRQSEVIVCSFSGGRTSAYMAYRMRQARWPAFFVFANTGQEHDATLDFVKACDEAWGLDVIWVEAVFDMRYGHGVTHKQVSYGTARRMSDPIPGSPFDQLIDKVGSISVAAPKCTDRLKAMPIHDWKRKNGLRHNPHAIGIRADEMDRAAGWKSPFFFPLIEDWPTTKEEVNAFWETQPFKLKLPEHLGNCLWCYKKSERKLRQVAQDIPQAFDMPRWIEKKVGTSLPLYRKRRTVDQLLASSPSSDDLLDTPDEYGCGETCEPFAIKLEKP